MKIENSKLVISDELVEYLGNKFCRSKEIKSIFGSFHDFYKTYCVAVVVYEEKKSSSSKLFLQFVDAVEVRVVIFVTIIILSTFLPLLPVLIIILPEEIKKRLKSREEIMHIPEKRL